MKTHDIKNLIVPLSEYATVKKGATLFEAVLALEKAQQEFDQTKYRHRAVLVLGDTGNVIGKISQIDALKALEPGYLEMGKDKKVTSLGFNAKFLEDMKQQYSLLCKPMENICKKAAVNKVENFMSKVTEGEIVQIDASLDVVIHQMIMGNHQSLLVKEGEKVCGIVRLTDVFAAVFHIMKQCSF